MPARHAQAVGLIRWRARSFAKADRSRFLAKLDELIHAVRRAKRK